MKKVEGFLGVLLIFVIFISCSGAAGTASSGTVAAADASEMKLRWGHTHVPGTPIDLGTKRFSELMKEATKGAIIVDCYGSSQLGNERDLIEGVGIGAIDFTCVSGALTNFSKAFLVFDLPFLVVNTPEGKKKAYAIFDGAIGREVLDSLVPKGIRGLSYWENGFRNVINSKRDIKVPADLRGLKIRTMENELHLAYYNALGATPISMASSEAFMALSQGVIDGMDNNVTALYSQKTYETAKHLTLTSHVYTPQTVMMNLNLYNSLSSEHKQTVDRIVDEVRDWERQVSVQDVNASVKGMTDGGATVIEDLDFDLWRKACAPVYDSYRDKVNSAHLDAFLK
jgi:tripartite ATP-independent transporter DctP family solute receptor